MNSAGSSFTVYLLLCADGSIYVGQTSHLVRRLRLQQLGKAAKHTRERLPVRLIHGEPHPDLSKCPSTRTATKRWTRAKELALAPSASQTSGQKRQYQAEGQDGGRREGLFERVADSEVHDDGSDHEDGQAQRGGPGQDGQPDGGHQQRRQGDFCETDGDHDGGGQAVGGKLLLHVLRASPAPRAGFSEAQQPDVQDSESDDQLDKDDGDMHGVLGWRDFTECFIQSEEIAARAQA